MKPVSHRRRALAVPALLLVGAAALLALSASSAPATAESVRAAAKKPPMITLSSCKVSKLIAAIEEANATSAVDTIALKKGCAYMLTSGPFVGDGPNGLPIVTAPLEIVGNGATIGRDPTAPPFRLIQASGLTTSEVLALEGVTLRGGIATDGGAVWLDGGTLAISNTTLTDNAATRRGGAVYAVSSLPDNPGPPVIVALTGATFERNSVHAPDSVGTDVLGGGAVWAGGGGSLTVLDSTFTENSARVDGPGYPYAGALAANTDSVTIERTTFTGNTAPDGGGYGGGGAIFGSSPMTIVDSTFTANTDFALFWEGYDDTAKTLAVTRTTFTDNIPSAISGYRGPNTVTLVTASTFTGNTGWAALAAMGTTIVANSTFRGDGISAWGGNLHVTNTTVSGGSVGGASVTTLANTIVAGGSCSPGGLVDGGGNLGFNSPGCPGIPGDPKLLPLAWNGGPTQTMALGAGSAAIDAANGVTCAAAIGPPDFGAGGVDQRGVARPQALCDIGAYELVVP